MALDRVDDPQLGAVAFEDLAVLGVPPPAEGVGEHVEVGGDPLGLPFEPELDLGRREVPGHFEPDLVASAAILKQVKTGGGICLTSNLMVFPGGAPEVSGDDVGEKLEVCDVKKLEVGRGAAGNKFIDREVEDTNARESVVPAI